MFLDRRGLLMLAVLVGKTGFVVKSRYETGSVALSDGSGSRVRGA